ncbi:hypothetical protein B0J17DRAFT_582197 [Rhizoctonia solani]|nr:hypothetical protein B0J17DRAFT_582197 [Rhizoctonia solani]
MLRHTLDLYLDEMQDLLKQCRGITVSLSTIWRSLCQAGLTMKKRSVSSTLLKLVFLIPINWYLLMSPQLIAGQAIVVLHGACLELRLSAQLSLFVENSEFSILPALSLSGFLYMDIVEGSFTSRSFCSFIKGLLDVMTPYPGPNSVIVMDNCNIHKNQEILEMIEARYVCYKPFQIFYEFFTVL